MKQVYNLSAIKYKEIENFNKDDKIFSALDKLVTLISNPEELINITDKIKIRQNDWLMIYPAICMLLGESWELLNDDIDWDEVAFSYMSNIREIIQHHSANLQNSIFGGLSGFGFGAHALYKATSHYKKFINSLNDIIINNVEEEIKVAKLQINSVNMRVYDTIKGLSGIAGYLLLYKEDLKTRKCIESILEYFVVLIKDKEVLGYQVPGYYIPVENQLLSKDKNTYKMGNFNLGLSHGIAGPLTVLSLALNGGIEVKGQKESIKRVLDDLKKFNYVDENGAVYWPGRIHFEEYIQGKCFINKTRASWCYGTPGIARAMYLAGTSINDIQSIELAQKAIKGICYMKEEELMLNSPTICHGYAGLLSIIHAMYIDTGDIVYNECRIKILNKVLDYYKEDTCFGFFNIDPEDSFNGKYQLVEKNDISFLEGAIGVILVLLTFIKPVTTDWMRHLLIK